MDVVSPYAWVIWLALILIFVIVEMLTLDLTFLMLAVGSLGGLAAGLAGAPWWLQIILAGVLAVVLLAAIRPPLLRRLRRGADPARSNVAALMDLEGRVVTEVGSSGGLVKLANGETWTARLSPSTGAASMQPGARVRVSAIDGATALVVPAERNEQK